MTGSLRLPPRLALIADMVPKGVRLVDVGSDHGLLPIYLLCSGAVSSAVATDIHAGPLSRAAGNARDYGAEHLKCVLCDGLASVSPEEADCIVIAGMGGETIVSILRAAAWACQGRTLLLQPMTHPELLRKAFTTLSLRIEQERLVLDGGRIYSVIQAAGGRPQRLSEAEAYTGFYPLVSREALFERFLRDLERRNSAVARGLTRSSKREDALRLRYLHYLSGQFKEMREQYANDR